MTDAPKREVLAGWAAAELESALTVPADPGAAAFFDVDNTMMQGASIYWLARGLAALASVRKHARGVESILFIGRSAPILHPEFERISCAWSASA